MKKKKVVIISAVVVVCILIAIFAFLSVGRAGGEIGFEATVNRVEDGVAYATVTDDEAGFLAKKLPETIMFSLADLSETEVSAGDEIYGNYLSGTISGQTVEVVNFVIKGE